jgi:hypothetical protein
MTTRYCPVCDMLMHHESWWDDVHFCYDSICSCPECGREDVGDDDS